MSLALHWWEKWFRLLTLGNDFYQDLDMIFSEDCLHGVHNHCDFLLDGVLFGDGRILTNLRFKLIFADERNEIISKWREFKLVNVVALILFSCWCRFARLREICLELWNKLEKPCFDKVDSFRLDVGTNYQILAFLEEWASHFYREIVCFVIVSLQDQALNVALLVRGTQLTLVSLCWAEITVTINAISLVLGSKCELLLGIDLPDDLSDYGPILLVFHQTARQGHVRHAMTFHHYGLVFVKVEYISLIALTLSRIQLQLILSQIFKSWLLVLL